MESLKPSVSVLILTYNEELNVKHCLESVTELSDDILVVDSFSEDRTLDIVKQYTPETYQHPFESWGAQVNWALDNLPFEGDWILRLDADELLTPELRRELIETLPSLPDNVTGLYCKRRVYFMGRWIRHGGYYPTWLLRIFRRGRVRFEYHLGEAEHAIVQEGTTMRLRHDIIDYNRKDLAFWTVKHEGYASREVASLVLARQNSDRRLELQPALFSTPERRKRWLKTRVYGRFPPFSRAFMYFLYRYFLRLGLLDGVEGLIFHVLQGFWYRFYVDAKIYEASKQG